MNADENWIPVDVQLPTQDGEYLCAVVKRFNTQPVVMHCKFLINANRFNVWPLRVTSWRHLPPPPNE